MEIMSKWTDESGNKYTNTQWKRLILLQVSKVGAKFKDRKSVWNIMFCLGKIVAQYYRLDGNFWLLQKKKRILMAEDEREKWIKIFERVLKRLWMVNNM